MKEFEVYSDRFKDMVPAVDYKGKKNIKIISYGQFSMYATCPKSWALKHIDRHRIDDPSIHLVFGTALHTVVQRLLFLIYNVSIKSAIEYNYSSDLAKEMALEYGKMQKKYKVHFSDKVEMKLFHIQGSSIVKYILAHRKEHFDPRQTELVAIEMPLYIPMIKGGVDVVMLLSYLDVVLYDKLSKRIKIMDIKTSTKGWSKWDKDDKLKQWQLVLYKKYFADQYKFDIDDIDIEFFIVKRTLNMENQYPQKRIQLFNPPSGKVSVNRMETKYKDFINSAFNADGTYNTNNTYVPLAGIQGKNCMFCPYKDRVDLCPPSKRMLSATFKLQN